MTVAEYKRALEPHEADWLTALEAHAFETGAPLETVLAESLIEQHREAAELETANTHLRESLAKLAAAHRGAAA